MSFNRSPFAFDDIKEVFERALNAPKGIRIQCKTRGAAVSLRSRFNYWRSRNREDNRKTYEADHPLHNNSIYDRLILRIGPKGDLNEATLFIEHHTSENLLIEEIT